VKNRIVIITEAGQLSELFKFLKNDNTIEQLQEEFFKRADNPSQKQAPGA